MEELKIVGFGSEVAAEDSRLYTVICQAQGHTSLPCVACRTDAHSLLFFIICMIGKKLVILGAPSGLFGQQAALFL